MCGRINHAGLTSGQLFDWLSRGIRPEFPEEPIPQRYNVPPTSMIPILRPDGPDLRLDLARWWLIPHWHRGTLKEQKAATFNARSDRVATAPAFRDAYRRNRCVVPIAGYYEWQTEGKTKRPHYIHPAGNAPALLLAGLWTSVTLPEFQGLTCTIVTEASSDPMTTLHDRAPVMMPADAIDAWLEGRSIEELTRLSQDGISWHEVGAAVGKVGNEGPELIEALA